jgi:hypothetical protein
VFSCKETEFNASDKCEFGVTDHVFLAPSFGDYRLLSGSAAVGCGDASLTKRISIYNPIASWKEYIEEKYYYRDFYGNEIPKTGTINCGAIQESVNPAGGCVVFYGDNTVQWETDIGKMYLKDRRSYAYAETYPTQWCAQATFGNGKPLFKYDLLPECTKQLAHYPHFDGKFWFSPPPKDEVITNHAYAAHDVYYVDVNSKARIS